MLYLDNSATTPLSPAAIAAIEKHLGTFGNPSSLHAAGQEARALVEHARRQVAGALGIKSLHPGELIFTASGTEANATAIYGTAFAKERRHASGACVARQILTTDCEHPAVEEAMCRLEQNGFTVVRIPTRGGVLDVDAALHALETPTLLVSMMLVNNETGSVFDVARIFAAAKAKDPATVTHCDAVQGFLKVPFSPAFLHADLVTVSGHKIHAPKGVGALYIHPDILKTKRIVPHVTGGGQEFGLRSGTENTLGLVAFGAAAEAGGRSVAADIAHMAALRDHLDERLTAMAIQVNRPAGARAPHIVSLTLPQIKSQTMLNYLSGKGICVSSGSACSSKATRVSRTLLAFGLTEREADCTLRVSFSACNTAEEVERFCEVLAEGVATLVRIRK